MSLVQDFCEKASVRVATIAMAAFTAVSSLSGCAGMSKLADAEIADIPVGRVLTTGIIRGSKPAREELRRGASSELRVRACQNETGIPTMTRGEPCQSQNQRDVGVEPRLRPTGPQ